MSSNKRETEQAIGELRRVLDETRGMDRRRFLKRLGQATAGSALLTSFSGLMSSAQAAGNPLTTFGWGGSWKDNMYKAYYTPWSEKTGTKVNYLSPYSFSKLVAMHEAKAMQVDTLSLGSVDMIRAQEKGMIAPIDWSRIDKSQFSPQQLNFPNAISSITLSDVLVYNREKWPGDNHPKNWADFWDVKKFPGPRAMERRGEKAILIALMADGMDPKDPKMYPVDYDRAFKKLDEIKPHINKWWKRGGEHQQLIENGEVDLQQMWNGRAGDSIVNNGAPYAIQWNQALYSGVLQGWVILTGAPNPDAAHDLVNFAPRAEPQAVFARSLFYGPTNLGAYKLLDDKVGRMLPSHPDNVAVAHTLNYVYLSTHVTEMRRRFEEWLQS